MFETESANVDRSAVITGGPRDEDWKALHARLRSIAKRRVALEAEEARYLIEAEETDLYRRLGYTTMTEYMERELYWGPHAAKERLRVARELAALPLIAGLFNDGELCFSAVRELTRVATPETEEAFLRKAHGRTAHDIQQMVAGLKRGDEPDAPPDPRYITKRIVLEVSVETEAMWRRTRNGLDEASSERLSDDMFAQTLCRRATEEKTTDAVPSRPVQTAVTTCRACKQSFVETGGESLPIDEATTSRLMCDAEHIGDLESDEITRVAPTIPAAIRRKVFHRDHFACVVPGCRSKRHLDLHHVVPRQHGGDHSMSNIAVLCFGCHQRHHAGSLKITGRAPDLHFAWARDDDVDSAMSPSWDWTDSEANANADP
jgi:hypothetical protein